MRKSLTILLLVATTFAFGENETPPAIQALKNAGITVWSIGNGKWKTTSAGSTKVLNEDGTVFIECANLKSSSEGRYVIARKIEYTPAFILETKDYIGGNTYAVTTHFRGEEKWVETDFDILDEDGNSILQFPINGASYYVDGKCAVKVGKLWGFIDKDGNWLCEPKFAHANLLVGKYGIISDEFGSNVGIINDQYEIVIPVTPRLFNVRRFEVNGEYVIYTDDKKGNHYEIEKLVDLYNSNGQNLNKTIKAYKELYSTAFPSR